MPDSKVIHDSVHGSVKLSGVYLDLLQRAEMQRLHGVHQLGLSVPCVPGRAPHPDGAFPGTYQIASRMAAALEIPEQERSAVLAAALSTTSDMPPTPTRSNASWKNGPV